MDPQEGQGENDCAAHDWEHSDDTDAPAGDVANAPSLELSAVSRSKLWERSFAPRAAQQVQAKKADVTVGPSVAETPPPVMMGRAILRAQLASALVSGARAMAMVSVGYENSRFAGRYPLGKNQPAVETKHGFTFERVGTGEMRVLGGACSEVLGGSNLANLLRDG